MRITRAMVRALGIDKEAAEREMDRKSRLMNRQDSLLKQFNANQKRRRKAQRRLAQWNSR